MNLQNILHEIESVDPEFGDRVSPRRAAIRTFLRGASLAALPVAFGGLLKKAYGKTNESVNDVLNYALTLEYLEAEFYTTAVSKAAAIGIPNGAPLAAITTIRDHENAHVAFLKGALGAAAIAKPEFDFSGGSYAGGPGRGNGPFATALTSDYALFLAVAQTFEDTGVRAYKGRAGELMSDNAVLTYALQIHSVEARHAAHIRRMRKTAGGAYLTGDIMPWITGAQSNIDAKNATVNAAIQRSYAGEDATTQGGVAVTAFGSADSATEAFDEILTKDQVLAIVDGFIVP